MQNLTPLTSHCTTKVILHLQTIFCPLNVTPRSRNLQCILCFISNIIMSYEQQQFYLTENILRDRVVSARFFCNASSISFAPLPPILLLSNNSIKLLTYRDLEQSMNSSSVSRVQFPLLLHLQYCQMLLNGSHTKRQSTVSCIESAPFLLNVKNIERNDHCNTMVHNFQYGHFKAQCCVPQVYRSPDSPGEDFNVTYVSQCMVLLQSKSDSLCSFIPNYIFLYQQYHNISIPRSRIVNEWFFCNASPISFAPSSPILLYAVNDIQQ
eukprot:TRINITY_DN2986_c2_g1_i4.p1 TRINITY_DN2986_c2_g1~~TRINITY_DN2986_c2_g1_i4.p1  ORF type:complete len:266 (+),score=-36.98 TRINITY_DN2986_c2_g1_i4:591-1388(+)